MQTGENIFPSFFCSFTLLAPPCWDWHYICYRIRTNWVGGCGGSGLTRKGHLSYLERDYLQPQWFVILSKFVLKSKSQIVPPENDWIWYFTNLESFKLILAWLLKLFYDLLNIRKVRNLSSEKFVSQSQSNSVIYSEQMANAGNSMECKNDPHKMKNVPSRYN